MLKTLADQLEKQVELNRKIRGAMTYPIVVVSVIGDHLRGDDDLHRPDLQEAVQDAWAASCRCRPGLVITISNTLASWQRGRRHRRGRRRRSSRSGGGSRPRTAGMKWDRVQDEAPDLRAAHPQGGAGPVRLHPLVPAVGRRAGDGGPRHRRQRRRATPSWPRPTRRSRPRSAKASPSPSRCASNDVFPNLVVQMVEVGEQTGALDDMLQRVSDFYMGEVDQTVDNLTSILEPLLVVIMGVVVGTIIISLYLPMFDYIKYVKWRGQLPARRCSTAVADVAASRATRRYAAPAGASADDPAITALRRALASPAAGVAGAALGARDLAAGRRWRYGCWPGTAANSGHRHRLRPPAVVVADPGGAGGGGVRAVASCWSSSPAVAPPAASAPAAARWPA